MIEIQKFTRSILRQENKKKKKKRKRNMENKFKFKTVYKKEKEILR